MATIAETRISTSADGSICTGLPIWPSIGTLSLGMYSGNQPKNYLVNVSPKILWFRFTASLFYEFFAGLCGPAFAVSMNLEGETTGNSLSLTVSDDEVQAGMAAGLQFNLGATLKLEHYAVFSGWKTDLDFTPEIDFDIIGLFVSAIKWAMQEGGGEGDAEIKPVPNSKGYWGMVGYSSQSFGYTDTAVAEPKVQIPIDVVPEIEELEAVNVALHALLGELSMGPSIYFGIPVTVKVNSITIDGAKYTGITPSGDGKLTGTTSDTPPFGNPSKMQVELSHSAGFDFGGGAYAEVSILKIFSLSGSFDVSIIGLYAEAFKMEPASTYFNNTLENDIGSTIVASAATSDTQTASFRVVLEPATA